MGQDQAIEPRGVPAETILAMFDQLPELIVLIGADGRVRHANARLLHEADHVFFQSAFCRLGADRFYGERTGPAEVLHNPVDTSRFVPAPRPTRPLTLLLGGSQYQRYRVETALEALAIVRRDDPKARLIVAGALSFAPDAAAATASLAIGARIASWVLA